MNQTTFQSADQHQQISLLLPWYVNQSLELNERQRVEHHVRGCMLCRRELVHLAKLAAAVKETSDLDVAAEASFNAMRARLQARRQQSVSNDVPAPDDTLEKRADRKPGSPDKVSTRYRLFPEGRGLRLAIAASLLLAIVPFAMRYGQSPVATDYYTLSDLKPESGAGSLLRVVFVKSMSDNDIDALLSKVHGQRMEGPNSVGAYTIRIDDKDAPNLASAIAFLREQADVMLAEPVSSQP
ncbi:MAG: hypothetical protein LUQ11_09125 [Methylococcaceae bacterium]|nr:hypothetical protein [Methylococcaceae bacterium]